MRDQATTDEVEKYGAYSENTNNTGYKVFLLQRKLYYKAKQEPTFRFYSLYGHVYSKKVLLEAYQRVIANNGSPGVDGVKVTDISELEGGVPLYLSELSEELKEKRYKPQAIKRVYIPKANGKKRPLGIPTVRDRIVQAAVMLVIEPIFESEFMNQSYGFRPKRGAHDALQEIKSHLDKGYEEVYDADLSSYFDTIPHNKLQKCLERKISDRHILKLIRMFIECTVKDEDGSIKKPTSGTPQGGVISPLLANIYLHWLEKTFYKQGSPGEWAKAHIVRYADDFVILARYISPRIENWVSYLIEERLGLTINKEKTSVKRLHKNESFNFLGYTFRRPESNYSQGRRYTIMSPSEKSVKSMRAKLKETIVLSGKYLPIQCMVGKVNQMLRGWSQYFSLGYCGYAKRDIMYYTHYRLRLTCKRKGQRAPKPPKGRSWYNYLHEEFGLMKI